MTEDRDFKLSAVPRDGSERGVEVVDGIREVVVGCLAFVLQRLPQSSRILVVDAWCGQADEDALETSSDIGDIGDLHVARRAR